MAVDFLSNVSDSIATFFSPDPITGQKVEKDVMRTRSRRWVKRYVRPCSLCDIQIVLDKEWNDPICSDCASSCTL